MVKPIAVAATRGAWYRQWRLVSLDGSTMDVADEDANDQAFGRPGSSRGSSAYPQFRFVSLVESGTHVLFGTRMGPYLTGENTLAKEVLGAGACQGGCRLGHAAKGWVSMLLKCAVTTESRSGLSVTTPM